MAQWAELHPLPGEARATARPPLRRPASDGRRCELRARTEFGLRVIGRSQPTARTASLPGISFRRSGLWTQREAVV